jgi:hypothetical protein
MPAKAAARIEQAQQKILADLVAKTPAPSWATGLNPMLYLGGVGYTDPKTGSAYDPAGNLVYEVPKIRSGMDDLPIIMSMVATMFPPIAPFVQAYNAVKAIDEGNVLGFILNAAGAGAKIPGLDASTAKLLSDVSTGAKIVQAVQSKDPLKIFSSVVNLPNVDPDLKDLSIVVNTANAISKGDIAGAFNGISKISDRDSVGRLTDRFNDIVAGQDVAALDPSQVAALTPATDEQAAQEQADRERAARDAVRTSEKTIEDTLTDSGLVTDTQDQATQEAERIAQEQADREQAARDAVRTSERTIEDQLTDSGLVSNADDEKKLAGVEVTGKAITDTDLPITGGTGDNRITDSSLPVNPNVGTPTPALESKDISGKALTDTDLPITGDTGNNRITDSSLPVNPDVGGNKLAPVTVTGKREDLIPLEEMPPLPSSKVTPVIAGTPQEPKPTIPTIPKLPTAPAKPTTPVKTTAPAATPAEQLYQTTTQSNPTTLADIKYYLDMTGTDILPPTTQHNPLESLLNQSSQPMSLDELLRHLRS